MAQPRGPNPENLAERSQFMSQYHDDVQTLWEQAVDSQEKAAQGLEWLRIVHAHKELSFNTAVRKIVEEYFNGDPITLQDFETAYGIESIPGRQTLRQMIEGCPQTIAEHNAKLKKLDHEELQKKAQEEQAVRNADRAHPIVPQVPPGSLILPLFVNKRWLKEVSSKTIKSLRIRWDREHGEGSFNQLLEIRISGADATELRRLAGRELGGE